MIEQTSPNSKGKGEMERAETMSDFEAAERLGFHVRYEPDSGKLFWRERGPEWFPTAHSHLAWNTRWAGKEAFKATRPNGYKAGSFQGRAYLAHRVAWAVYYGSWPSGPIDHISGDPADNRITNLRDASPTENARNAKRLSTNTSGQTGVYWNKLRRKWHAYISGKFIGLFASFEEAVAARKAAEYAFGYHENHGREGRP